MFSKLSIGTKVVGGFVLVGALMIATGIYTLGEFDKTRLAMSELFQNRTLPIAASAEFTESFLLERLALRTALTADRAELPKLRETHADELRDAQESVASLEKVEDADDEVKRELGQLKEVFASSSLKASRIFDLLEAGKRDEANALAAQMASENTRISELLKEYRQHQVAAVKARIDHDSETTQAKELATFITLLVATLVALVIGIAVSRSISRPLRRMAQVAQSLALGDVNQEIDHHSGDETGQLAEAFRDTIAYVQDVARGAQALAAGDLGVQVKPRSSGDVLSKSFVQAIATVRAMSEETQRLIAAAKDGQLATRGDATQFQGAYADIVRGVNEMLDAVVGPLNVAAEYVDRIAQGDMPPEITTRYRGDFNTIKDNLNELTGTLRSLVAEMGTMSREHDLGDIDVFLPEDRFKGAYQAMAKGLNDMVKGHIAVKKKAMACIAQFGRGNFDAPLERFPGKKAFINDTVEALRGNLKAVNAEVGTLIGATRAGKLDARGNAAAFAGDWAKLVGDLNALVEAFVAPIRVTADYVGRISRGEIPEKITDAYEGEFNSIKANLNTCIDAVRAMIADANLLSAAAVEGRLSTRADASKHEGDFRRIVEGVNRTLDAVLGPIHVATEVLRRLADQDLRARVTGEFQGDHARIKDAVNQTASALHDALATVAEAVEQVASASEQIAATSQSVSQGASEQASAIEETSSNMEEMLGITKQNSESTAQAKSLAMVAKKSADQGSAAMERMSEAMRSVKKGAEGTAAIIADVSEIAFQTNLLALNAAVEAARAGDAGRGFAVVADEVRSLAQRAKEAAKKTEALIQESLKLAGDGEALSKEVAGELDQIVSAVGKVTGIVGEISSSSQEQSRGIDQINRAITQMDKATQQAAGSAEESSSSAEELSSQAQALAGLVSRFKLERTQGAARGAKRLPARPLAQAQEPVFKQF
ncbi:MAG: methyl-accepting chemotaxis protein [Myxococcales bacterium]